MYKITVTSAEKKTLGKKLFTSQYPTKKEAEEARLQIIRRIAGVRRFAPCDAETGRTFMFVKPQAWHVGPIENN